MDPRISRVMVALLLVTIVPILATAQQVCDDFTGTSVNTSLWNPVSGTWTVANGQITGYSPLGDAYGDQANLLWIGSAGLQECTLDADMVVQGSAGRHRIVLYHSAGNKYNINYDWLAGFVSTEVKQNGGIYGPPHYASPAVYDTAQGAVNHARVVKSGAQITCFLNGKQVLSFTDSIWNGDFSVGLGSYGTSVYERACFAPTAQLQGQLCFGPAATYPTGANPVALCEADFNKDGKIDLAIANLGSNSVTILYGNGDGTFTPGGDYPTSARPHHIYSVDLNGDSYPDLVVSHYNDNPVLAVFINKGDGTFFPAVFYPAGLDDRNVTCADFNGDGYPDVAVADPWGNVAIYPNNGDGTLGSSYNISIPQSAVGICSADFNGDGKADICVTLSTNPGIVEILMGNGDGTFQTPISYSIPAGPLQPCAADFDRDGHMDIAIPCAAGNVISILRNRGDGTFETPVNYAVGTDPGDVVAADLNGDGILDLAVGDILNDTVSILTGNGDATFSPATYLTSGDYSYYLTTADFDRNGSADLAVVNENSSGVAVFLSCSTPTYTLILPSETFTCDTQKVIQPLEVRTSRPIVGASIPLKIPSGVIVDSIGLAPAARNWSQFKPVIRTDSGYLQILASAGNAPSLPVGLSTAFNIYFHAYQLCRTNTLIHWDTTLSSDPSRALSLADTSFATIYPGFDRLADSTEIIGYTPGNVNGKGIIDIGDLSCLVSYLTGGGSSCIPRMSAANMNGKGAVDIGDLSLLVSYLTGGGGIPVCGPSPAEVSAAKTLASTSLESAYVDGITTLSLSSQSDLSAVHIVLKGSVTAPVNSLAGKLDMLTGQANGVTNLILIDLKGKNTIEHGSQKLVEIPGQVAVVAATVSDLEFESWHPAINAANKLDELPKSFSLEQNYPNPFNPTTTISFSLPKTTNYTLTIYNVAGQVVKEFSGAAGPGTVHQVWDASKNASGVYFYRLTAGEFTQNRKMMLLK